jgi:hypothetical protein
VVVATDPIREAFDAAANALQTAVLLAARLETDQTELRRAIDRAARALAKVKTDTVRCVSLSAGIEGACSVATAQYLEQTLALNIVAKRR